MMFRINNINFSFFINAFDLTHLLQKDVDVGEFNRPVTSRTIT